MENEKGGKENDVSALVKRGNVRHIRGKAHRLLMGLDTQLVSKNWVGHRPHNLQGRSAFVEPRQSGQGINGQMLALAREDSGGVSESDHDFTTVWQSVRLMPAALRIAGWRPFGRHTQGVAHARTKDTADRPPAGSPRGTVLVVELVASA